MSKLAPEGITAAPGSAAISREDLEAILGRIDEGVSVQTPDGRIVYANDAAARLLGLDSRDEVLSAPMREHRSRFAISDVSGRPLEPAELPGERVRAGADQAELLVRFKPTAGGEEHVSLVRALRVLGDDGELRYVVSLFRAVTEEHAAETLRRLGQVTETALSHFSLRDLAPALLDELRTVFAADTAAILLLEDDGAHLMMRITVGFSEEAVSHAVPVPLGKGMAGRVAASRQTWVVEDLDEIELVSPVLRASGIRSLIAVPLLLEDRIIGVVHVGSRERQHFGGEDARLMELISDRITLAVNHSALLDAEREAQERLAFLGEASAILASSLDYDDTLSRIATLALSRFAEWCAVDMVRDDGSIGRLATADGGAAPTPELDRDDDAGVPLVLRTGEPELLFEMLGVDSAIIAPIVSRGRVLGAISFVRTTDGKSYSAADLELARDLARRAGIAVDNAQLYRAAEERAQAARVLASVGDGVVLIDRAGIVRYWNRAAETITGLAGAAVIDRTAADAIPGWKEVIQRVPVSFDAAAAPRAQSLPLAVGERELWLSVTGVAVVDGTVYAFRDLTEERALESMKAEFVSTVSHELRTPLAAIYGAAMTLRRDDILLDLDQNATLLNVITNESDRLARTVNAILWASRLDTDALATTIETCDAELLAREVVDAQRIHLPENVRLEFVVEDGLPPVAADADKVRQVLVNLVDNAVKYSPDGGEVRLELAKEGRSIRFAVTDHGLGIPYREQRRIFDKFYRLDPDMTRGIGGTGLGLFICRELVQRMAGRIWVTSEPGGGSTFAFELPKAEGTPASPAPLG
ncbi:MAG TPA: ATP-binding protein [Gaiellaceae bacterium]